MNPRNFMARGMELRTKVIQQAIAGLTVTHPPETQLK
jgi:hypothetical protein